MAVEIEHKYLVVNDSFRDMACESHAIAQGYLCRKAECTARVRVWDDKGYITVKGMSANASRAEYEYEIPVEDARQMLQSLCEATLSKVRHIVWHAGNKWEIDEFHGPLAGFVMAEIEIPSPDYDYPLPPFVGKNVTSDPRYYNSNLVALSAPPADD